MSKIEVPYRIFKEHNTEYIQVAIPTPIIIVKDEINKLFIRGLNANKTDIVEKEGYLAPKHQYPLNDLAKLTDYKSGKSLVKYPLWIVMQTTLPKKINDRLIKPITLGLLDKILGESEGRNVFVKGTVYFGDSSVPYERFSWLKSTTQLGKTRMDPNYVFYNKESIEPFLKVWEEVKLWQGWLAINVFLKSREYESSLVG